MPYAYGYARVSFLDDETEQDLRKNRGDRTISIDTQRERVRYYLDYQRRLGSFVGIDFAPKGWIGIRHDGQDTTDGFFVDRDVSAYKRPFLSRPGGRRLSAALEPGDHVIFSRLDRAFRNVQDALVTLELWQRRDIGIHFLDPQVDLSTAHGRAFLQMSAVWAEFSSALHSERMREVAAQAKRTGRTTNGRKPHGWLLKPSARVPQPDMEERAILAFIIHLREVGGLSWAKISDAVEERLARRESRLPVPAYEGDSARRFGRARCARAYLAAKELNLGPSSTF